ncbi:MAG TPA: hypothetical protein VGU63_13650 [Candidatus Acidoferrales bacterium]|nr:hypothetical protein [Candidatus Acidoferrales bacterium]
MMMILTTLVSVAILIGLLWLLFGSRGPEATPGGDDLRIENLLPVNCRHFPQIAQMLKSEDFLFMQRRAPHRMEGEWRAERRRILGQYLKGLRQDFARLRRLTRMIAALSPEIRKGQEWEWMRLGLQFQVSYRIVEVKIALGGLSPEGIAGLTGLLTQFAGELESRMSLLAGYSPSRMRMDVGG